MYPISIAIQSTRPIESIEQIESLEPTVGDLHLALHGARLKATARTCPVSSELPMPLLQPGSRTAPSDVRYARQLLGALNRRWTLGI